MIHKIIIEYDSEDIDPVIALESINQFELPWVKAIRGGV